MHQVKSYGLLRSRVDNIAVWVARLMRYTPISEISLELVKFDTQAMQHPEISGQEYQQGTLAGYEIREYLLEKWDRQCAYCGRKDIPLQIEHIQPRANGGTNHISNLCLSCEFCNIRKASRVWTNHRTTVPQPCSIPDARDYANACSRKALVGRNAASDALPNERDG
jgi:5-methylcytosine-specific restriction endonuclease McrA